VVLHLITLGEDDNNDDGDAASALGMAIELGAMGGRRSMMLHRVEGWSRIAAWAMPRNVASRRPKGGKTEALEFPAIKLNFNTSCGYSRP